MKVGDKVLLREGSKDVITEIRPHHAFALVGKLGIYTRTGTYWEGGEECGGDILYILRKTKKSIPKTEQK